MPCAASFLRDQINRRDDFRVVDLPEFAHRAGKIIGADADDVEPFDRKDRIDIGYGFDVFDLDGDQWIGCDLD